MIIGVCGLGWTGSGAVKDLLTEYSEITNVGKTEGDYEFNFVYRPDGILDLRYQLFEGACRDVSSKIAVNRFVEKIKRDCEMPSRIQRLTKNRYLELSRKYVDDITQIQFQDFIHKDYEEGGRIKRLEGRIRARLQRIVNKKVDHFIPIQFLQLWHGFCIPWQKPALPGSF